MSIQVCYPRRFFPCGAITKRNRQTQYINYKRNHGYVTAVYTRTQNFQFWVFLCIHHDAENVGDFLCIYNRTVAHSARVNLGFFMYTPPRCRALRAGKFWGKKGLWTGGWGLKRGCEREFWGNCFSVLGQNGEKCTKSRTSFKERDLFLHNLA
jgi:hypothetical protein